MRRRSGTTFLAVGLILGMIAGSAVLLFKHWLIAELVDVLDDEVKESCDCTLAFDSFDISLTRLNGRATNVRILEKGKPALSFKEIRASFSLSEIFSKRVFIEQLTLSDGVADGVGPKSATFRFIDHLTTSPPPELDRPGKWKATLNNLEIVNSRLREPFPTSELIGEGVSLKVRREGERFHLNPNIKNLRYRSYRGAERKEVVELPLGVLNANLTIDDDFTVFDSLTLGRDASSISLVARVDTNRGDQCSGDGKFSIDSQYLGLPEWLKGTISGRPSMGGTLGSPVLTGPMTSPHEPPLTLIFDNTAPIPLEDVDGRLVVDVNHGDPIVTVDQLRAKGPGSILTSSRPLVFSDKGLDAGFSVKMETFAYGPFGVTGADASISVEERTEGTTTTFEIRSEDLKVQGTSLGPSALQVILKPDAVEVSVKNTDDRQGRLEASGTILLRDGAEAKLDKGELKLDGYRYPLAVPIDETKLAPVALTGSLPLSGPLDLARLTGSGPVTATFPALAAGLPLSGTVELGEGLLSAAVASRETAVSAHLNLDLAGPKNGSLKVDVPQTQLSAFIANNECGKVIGNLDYSFPISEPLSGSGTLLLNTLDWGCNPYTLKFQDNLKLPISGGSVKISGVRIEGVNSELDINGTIGFDKGFDLQIGGDVLMSALLPFLGAVDDVQGRLATNMVISGPLGAPVLSGKASLENGELGVSSPEIGAHGVSGTFELADGRIGIGRLAGSLNTGTFEISGDVFPFEFSRSQVVMQLSGVTVEPLQDASVTFSGNLRLSLAESGKQTLSGAVTIDSAEIAYDLDPQMLLVKAIAGYLLPSTVRTEASRRPFDLDLDLSITAPRNIYVLTPLVSAELSAQLTARGTAAQPALQGTMQVLSGWIAIKDNQFNITAGTATFKPDSIEPTIDIASEGTLRNNSGENILVLLEASGPLRSPRINLSSDRGLTHDELLLLLTSSRSLTGRTMANTVGRQFGSDQRFLLSSDTFSSFGSFIRSLARIDALSLEPIYNPYTGALEPGIVGRKQLAERLALVGESTFGTVSNSRAGLVYNLAPSLNASGFIESVSTRQNTAISADLTYTILSEQARFLKVNVTGLEGNDEGTLLSAARLGPSSRVRNTPESLASVKRDLLDYLVREGYLRASIEVSCRSGSEYCNELDIDAREGPRFTIEGFDTKGDPVPEAAHPAVESAFEIDEAALTSTLRRAEERLIIALRNEGFVAARVIAAYEFAQSPGKVRGVMNVDLRQPISFVFGGNTVFSAAEFLDSIQLFERKRPFGNNTIHLLIQNIERMYHEKGYLFVQVTYTEDKSNPPRLTYAVDIKEDTPFQVESLVVRSKTSLPLKRIQAVLRELGLSEQVALFDPTYAIPDQLDTLRELLVSVFQHEGFPNVEASYEISLADGEKSLDVVFNVSEGEAFRASSVTVQRAPLDFRLPPTPTAPSSLPRINRFVAQILDRLRDEGYLYPGVTIDFDPETGGIEIDVEAGHRTSLTSIEFDGLGRVSRETVQRFTTLRAGQPYRISDINATKRSLLRSGLFSRVEVVPHDGSLDSPSESLIIRVAERPLQTLELGGGLNSEFGIHVFGEAVDKSLFADGKSLALRLDSYVSGFESDVDSSGGVDVGQGFASLRYDDPSLLGSELSLAEELRFQRQNLSTQEYDLERVSGSSYLYKQFESGFAVSGGHTLLLDNIENVSPDAIISPLDSGAVRIGFLSASIALDRRDDPLLPNSGYTFTLEPRLSHAGLGSEADFGAVTSRATAIVPLELLSPRFSIGLGLIGGIAKPFGRTEQIPITQRFYLGGRTTVRGFRENSLGPRGSEGAVIGGDAMVAGSSQLQYLISPEVSAHVFIDAGNVFLRDDEESGSVLRRSTGLGFRYLSPIGPIGLDIGHPLDEKDGEPSLRLHFSVGSNF